MIFLKLAKVRTGFVWNQISIISQIISVYGTLQQLLLLSSFRGTNSSLSHTLDQEESKGQVRSFWLANADTILASDWSHLSTDGCQCPLYEREQRSAHSGIICDWSKYILSSIISWLSFVTLSITVFLIQDSRMTCLDRYDHSSFVLKTCETSDKTVLCFVLAPLKNKSPRSGLKRGHGHQ